MSGSPGRVIRAPSPLVSADFLRAYVLTMRPYLLFVSGVTGIAGMALVGGMSASWTFALGSAFFLSYGFGQALTDCFQVDTDSISAPYRPLVQGRIRRAHVLAVSLVGLVGVGAALIIANPWNLPLVVAAIAGLATYTKFKRLWWSGPFYNAWIVAVLALTGVLAARGIGRVDPGPLPGPALTGTLTAVFFGYANFVLAGYFKDVTADRLTGYRTLPVKVGLGVSAFVSDVLAGLAVGGALLAIEASGLRVGALDTTPGWIVSLVLVALGAGTSLVAQRRLHQVREDRHAHRAIAPVVHAYVLMLAGIASAYRPRWSAILGLFLVAYWLTLRARPVREQI